MPNGSASQNAGSGPTTAGSSGLGINVVSGTGVTAYKKGVDDAYSQFQSQPVPGGDHGSLSAASINTLSVGVPILVFGLIVTGVTSMMMRRASPGQVLRLYGTIMAITLTCFLAVSGVASSNVAAGIGFLGTIVGYLLGRPTQAQSTTTGDGRQVDGAVRHRADGEVAG